MTNEEYFAEFKQQIKDNRIVLFIKHDWGTCRCRNAVPAHALLTELLGEDGFAMFAMGTSVEKKEAMKEFSNWPTFPQLYINGKLIGGNDDMQELHKEGKLEAMLAA